MAEAEGTAAGAVAAAEAAAAAAAAATAAGGAGGSAAAGGAGGSAAAGAGALADAERAYQQGVACINRQNFDDAIDLLARALELRVGEWGAESVRCAKSYLKYGRALFLKAQSDSGVFGSDELKQAGEGVAAGSSGAGAAGGSGAGAGAGAGVSPADAKGKGKEKAPADTDDGEGAAAGGSSGSEGAAAAAAAAGAGAGAGAPEEEDGGDMQLAWEMYEVARSLWESAAPGEVEMRDELLADTYMALGEHSLEREDFQGCLKDYYTALQLYERAEPRADQLIVAQAHFRTAMALQWVPRHDEAVKECSKARAILEGAFKEASAAGMAEDAADIAAVLQDIMLKEEDIKLEAANAAALAEKQKADAAAAGSAGAGAGAFDKPQLTGTNGAQGPVVVKNLGVVGGNKKKITLQPVGGAPSAPGANPAAPAAAGVPPKRAAAPVDAPPAADAKKAKIGDVPVEKPPECQTQ